MEGVEIGIGCLEVTHLVLQLYLEIGVGVFFLLDELLKLWGIHHYLQLWLKLLFLEDQNVLSLCLLLNWLALWQLLGRKDGDELPGDLDVPGPGGSGGDEMDVLLQRIYFSVGR